MLRALHEAGVRPDLILGTSIGAFNGSVIVDRDLNATPRPMKIAHSNLKTEATRAVRLIGQARFFANGWMTAGPAAALDVTLKASEAQVWTLA